jgi:CheY-like chemotaxis protein
MLSPSGSSVTKLSNGQEDPERVVLLVEDEADWRDLLATILNDAGYRVMSAANGFEALRALEQCDGRCDVVILDLMMPVMNGWDFRRRQLQDPRLKAIPVLLMSAGAHIAAATADLQAAGYLAKPVTAEELVDKVEALMLPTEAGVA